MGVDGCCYQSRLQCSVQLAKSFAVTGIELLHGSLFCDRALYSWHVHAYGKKMALARKALFLRCIIVRNYLIGTHACMSFCTKNAARFAPLSRTRNVGLLMFVKLTIIFVSKKGVCRHQDKQYSTVWSSCLIACELFPKHRLQFTQAQFTHILHRAYYTLLKIGQVGKRACSRN